jgi:hypothetical protein
MIASVPQVIEIRQEAKELGDQNLAVVGIIYVI